MTKLQSVGATIIPCKELFQNLNDSQVLLMMMWIYICFGLIFQIKIEHILIPSLGVM